nr:hypothetical protein [uncultured Celeribacter sp.]
MFETIPRLTPMRVIACPWGGDPRQRHCTLSAPHPKNVSSAHEFGKIASPPERVMPEACIRMTDHAAAYGLDSACRVQASNAVSHTEDKRQDNG